MKTTILSAALMVASFTTFAQVGVGTTTPNASAALDITSTSKGFLLPRLTQAQMNAIASPAEGLIIYCTNCIEKGLIIYNGSYFENVASGVNTEVASAFAEILEDSGSPGGASNANGIPVSFAQLQLIGLIDLDAGSLVTYQQEIVFEVGFSNPPTLAEVQAIIDTVNDFNLTLTTVRSTTGKTWLNRNLGATQVATSSNDVDSYGDLYQWGRNTDGHEKRTSSSITGPVASGSEGANFITSSTSPKDWLSSQDDTRWNGANKGAQDPCPAGFRVPTFTELDAERLAFSSNSAAGAFNSPLKFPTAGERTTNGLFTQVGSAGTYWSSMASSTGSRTIWFTGSSTGTTSRRDRAYGHSVRCIQE